MTTQVLSARRPILSSLAMRRHQSQIKPRCSVRATVSPPDVRESACHGWLVSPAALPAGSCVRRAPCLFVCVLFSRPEIAGLHTAASVRSKVRSCRRARDTRVLAALVETPKLRAVSTIEQSFVDQRLTAVRKLGRRRPTDRKSVV